MTTDTLIVHESPSPSLLRVWWSNRNLRYDVAMSSIIIILNIAATVYMGTHKVPLSKTNLVSTTFIIFTKVYVITGTFSCIVWVMAIEDVSLSEAYFVGRICHTSGFGIFLDLLYSISPHLALHFGLPFLLWFVLAIIAPCCPYLWKGLCKRVQKLRDWWKFVNQPQSSLLYLSPYGNRECASASFTGCICQILGFVVLLHLLYCISPRLAGRSILWSTLLLVIWYIAAIFGPLLREAMQALRDWWKFVNQPQLHKSQM